MKHRSRKSFVGQYKYIRRLIVIPTVSAALGFFINSPGSFWGIITSSIILSLFLIAEFVSLVFNNVAQKQLAFLKMRINMISEIYNIRTIQWSRILNKVKRMEAGNIKHLREVHDENALTTREAIEKIISFFGKQFENEIIKYFYKDSSGINLTISYFQRANDGNGLVIRRRESIYTSEFHEDRELANFRQVIFHKDDGSTLGTAWKNRDIVCVENTDNEVAKNTDKRFMESRKSHRIKSICCIPVHYNNYVFGVICITSSKAEVIKESDLFRDMIMEIFNPFIRQLILVELVKSVRDEYDKKFQPFYDDWKKQPLIVDT